MKKKIFVFTMLICCGGLLFTGCDKTKDTNEKKTGNQNNTTEKAKKSENSIVGKWEYESGGFVYTFNEDKTGTYDAAGTVMKFTYEIKGDKLSILYEGNTETFDTTYSIDGNKLNVKDSFGEDTIYIKK